MSVIPLLVILLLSPLSYIVNIFSFSVRLWLTEVAAKILSLTGSAAIPSGNIIMYAGNDYTVDPACMGLRMLATSLWLSLYVLHFIQKAQQRRLKFFAIIFVLCFVFVLNVITNLARIVLLVYFDIPPAHIMHDITGLGCFLVYTVIPVMILLKLIVKWFGKLAGSNVSARKEMNRAHMIIPLITFTAVLLSVHNMRASTPSIKNSQYHVAGYSYDMFSKDVIRLKSDRALIYLKVIPAFYSAEHNPLVCWIGSGYEFEQLNETKLGTNSIYTGILKNNDDILYTAWWYDNGENRTISQLDWRWYMFTGSGRYFVVNVTCNTKLELETELEHILNENRLNGLMLSGVAGR